MKKRILSILLLCSMVPVSYTHLDVYKRQRRSRVRFLRAQVKPMAFDYKKEYKEYYMPTSRPEEQGQTDGLRVGP